MIAKEQLARRIALGLKAYKDNPVVLDADELSEVLDADIDAAVAAVVMAHEWDFAVGSATKACESGTAEYTLPGVSQNAWRLYEVKFGTGSNYSTYRTLTKKSPEQMSDMLQSYALSEVQYWVPIEPDGSAPRIQVVTTPSSADYNLFYRFWRKGVAYEELPGDMFLAPIIQGVRFLWGIADERAFHDSIQRVISEYDRPASPEDSTIRLDPAIRALNRQRNRRFGYGGLGESYVVLGDN